MMTLLRIAVRNLNRQKKRSILLGVAIAFGFMIITLVNAFAAGFVVNIRENVSQLIAGHLFITGYEKSASGRLTQPEWKRSECERKSGWPRKRRRPSSRGSNSRRGACKRRRG